MKIQKGSSSGKKTLENENDIPVAPEVVRMQVMRLSMSS